MSINYLLRLKKRLNARKELMNSRGEFIKNCGLLTFHNKNSLKASSATTSEEIKIKDQNDVDLIMRIIASYQKSKSLNIDGSMWKQFFLLYHLEIDDALMSGNLDRICKIFRDPVSTDFFYGFDILTKSFNSVFSKKSVRDAYSLLCLDGLVRFAESSGAIKIYNPETVNLLQDSFDADLLIELISKKCWNFSVPNLFPGEHGLLTSKGIISYRVPQALYQAWRVRQILSGFKQPKVLEIGGGLGRTAHYAYELGVKDYTLIDLPISAAAQSYFVGRAIGEDNIVLEGEDLKYNTNKVKILQPTSFLNGNLKYDLIINADSLTEMNETTVGSYWEKIKTSTSMFLSINHEANDVVINRLIQKERLDVSGFRFPYWMRKGYVEELIKF